ncbi:Eco57I restriction-modification methylase domain-containing protein [Akkermansiaceae bacterium]|nr:Eco57I restriction-modification methylase domain-containing protein [Akkermansiaceae bacterium]
MATNTLPKVIAGYNGFKIIHLQLAAKDLRKGQERQLIQRIRKDDPTLRALFVVSNYEQNQWHLINIPGTDEASGTALRLCFFRIGEDQDGNKLQVRTAAERLHLIDIEGLDPEITAQELQDHHNKAFNVESVSQDFFNEISNWYFWALSQVEFPQDTVLEGEEEKHRATSLIRFLTRIIFCWFLKEKRLIPESLFNRKELEAMLVDLDDDHCTYHQGILQNLFFATLNQRMGKDSKTGEAYRAFAKDEGFVKNRSTYGVDTLYRYEEHFKDEAKALGYFAEVPFLNGGLFECLDRTDSSGKKLYLDGFSRNKKKCSRISNKLFFASPQPIDLSEIYDDPKRRNSTVRGLLNILHAYNFTVEENTPVDEEIALDPELLGKVFENLLASYNEETKTTARKQTGSFYTPRAIVEFMVDESLKAHLYHPLIDLGRGDEEAKALLDSLLGYTEEATDFSEQETKALLESIHTCKILDPACGSGAFPMGMLQKLVHVVQKLDPDNFRWKQIQIDKASEIPDPSAQDAAIKAIKRDFEENGDDYGRKLYLIERCLYGTDIQPVAIQISKLRFFISLICDQNLNRSKAKNHGIRALPNLETKFVAADSLIKLPIETGDLFEDARLKEIELELSRHYHSHFSLQRRDQKLSVQKKIKALREEMTEIISHSFGFVSSEKARLLAHWDPFNTQAVAGFFDSKWMFGQSLSKGFDMIIGNPPYIQIQKFPADQKALWQSQNYETYAATADIYCLFYERGAQLLKQGGSLVYITSNKWMRAGYGKKLRHFFSEKVDTESVIDFGMAQNFGAATTYTSILRFYNQAPDDRVLTCYAADAKLAMSNPAAYFKENAIERPNLSAEPWVVLSKQRQVIKTLVESQGTALKDWGIEILYGIKTGLNVAFYIDTEQRKQLIQADPSSEEIIVPLLKGRDVEAYGNSWEGDWMISTFPSLKLREQNIPSPIITHLRKFYPKIKQTGEEFINSDGKKEKARKKTDNKWFETQDAIGYHQEFTKPKIIYPNMTKFLPFYYDRKDGFYGNQKCFIITSEHGHLGFLTAFFNSSLFKCCFRDNFPELLGNTYELSKIFVELIPIKKPNIQEDELFEKLVPLAQFAKAQGQLDAYSFLEGLIDACVMECYFGEHMAERDLCFISAIAPMLQDYDPDGSDPGQGLFLGQFVNQHNADSSEIRTQIARIPVESPDLLAVIQEEGKV